MSALVELAERRRKAGERYQRIACSGNKDGLREAARELVAANVALAKARAGADQ